jgi:predicted amidohydrolase
MNTITFTLIQTGLTWEDKAANLRMLRQKIEAIGEKTEIVVLPEMFSTGFSMGPEHLAETMEGPTLKWMHEIARQQKIILTGSLMMKEINPDSSKDIEESTEASYYNRLIWMLPNGEYGIYDKRHLFTYAGEHNSYTAGQKRLIASVKGWKINLQICYDLRFPVWSRQSYSSVGENPFEYDILVFVANWPASRALAWKTLLQARAIENQCYVIGVNRVGRDGNGIDHQGGSMVVGPLGDIVYQGSDREEVYTITLNKSNLEEVRKKYPFWADADGFNILRDL